MWIRKFVGLFIICVSSDQIFGFVCLSAVSYCCCCSCCCYCRSHCCHVVALAVMAARKNVSFMLNSFLCLQNLLPCQSNKRIPSLLFFPFLLCATFWRSLSLHSIFFFLVSLPPCLCSFYLCCFCGFCFLAYLLRRALQELRPSDDCASKYSRNLLGYKLYLLCSQLMSLLMLCVCILSVHKLTGESKRHRDETLERGGRATDIIISSHLPDGRMTLPSDAA